MTKKATGAQPQAAARRGRGNSREAILDAAERLVAEQGANRMTLDAVAGSAGVSKGGLLYNFPSKDALLKAMIERYVAKLGTATPAAAGRREASHFFENRLKAWEDRVIKRGAAGAGMLAAIAERPALLEPIRAAHAQIWARIARDKAVPDDALVAWLALEGLVILELFNTSPLSKSERARLIAKLRKLVA